MAEYGTQEGMSPMDGFGVLQTIVPIKLKNLFNNSYQKIIQLQ
jgi:hypothetical protein